MFYPYTNGGPPDRAEAAQVGARDLDDAQPSGERRRRRLIERASLRSETTFRDG